MLKEETDFYGRYAWSIMPYPSCAEIRRRLLQLAAEADLLEPDWCRRERLINVYLLASALLDTVDDYLVRGAADYSKVSDFFSLLSVPVTLIRKTTTGWSCARGMLAETGLRRWRESFSGWLHEIAVLLVSGESRQGTNLQNHVKKGEGGLRHAFPKRLSAMRARIPAAYHSQDLTHHDMVRLAEMYSERHPDRQEEILVIGLRTAGSFLAPVVRAALTLRGYASLQSLTIRPKGAIHPLDRQKILRSRKSRKDLRVLLVDEPPNTAKTLVKTVKMLRSCGFRDEALTILVPVHAANEDWLKPAVQASLGRTEIISLSPGEWYKAKLLRSEHLKKFLPLYFPDAPGVLEIIEDEQAAAINDRFERDPEMAYHSRLKRVFKIKTLPGSEERKILAKSIGWGWYGYRAAKIAAPLEAYIPRLHGIREGIMYMDWVDGSPGTGSEDGNGRAERIAGYVAQRARSLQMDRSEADPSHRQGNNGLQRLAGFLSRMYESRMRNLRQEWIRKELSGLDHHCPVVLDARMAPGEWIRAGGRWTKTDYEHHGFSKTASMNLTDPAYDLASAIIEFAMTDEEAERLLARYIGETADSDLRNRLIYYLVLCGRECLEETGARLKRPLSAEEGEACNRKYIHAWLTLNRELMKRSAQYCSGEPVRAWGRKTFMTDIDDVLEKNILGVPSTTACGIRALSMLRRHGVSCAINTARSLDEVRTYCRYYGLAGGVAEYGSVVWDDIAGQVRSLVSAQAMDDLYKLKSAAAQIPGVYIHPLYRHSLRLYTFDRERTIPVPDSMLGVLFSRLEIKSLKIHRTYVDTAVHDRSVDKGKGLLALREMTGAGRIGSAGDSEADLPMLIAADRGYLVGNSAPELKSSARQYGITLTKSAYQVGLFQAVTDFLRAEGPAGFRKRAAGPVDSPVSQRDLFWKLIQIPDMPPHRKWRQVLDRGIFQAVRALSS